MSLEVVQHPALTPLTGKQRLFALAYAANPNGIEAARTAYGNEDTDDNTLAAIGYENLRKPQIREALDALLSERVMSKVEAIARLSDEARDDVGDFFDVDGEGHLALNLARAKQEGRSRLLRRLRVRTTTYTRDDGTVVTEQSVDAETYDAQAAKDKILKSYGAYPSGSGPSVQVNVQQNANTLPPPQ